MLIEHKRNFHAMLTVKIGPIDAGIRGWIRRNVNQNRRFKITVQGTPCGIPCTKYSVCRNTVQASRGRQSTGRAEVGQRSVRLTCQHPDRIRGRIERQ